MNRLDRAILGALTLVALLLWWMVVRQWDPVFGPERDGPVAVCLPLFAWLAAPWEFKTDGSGPNPLFMGIGLLLLGGGLATQFLVLAVAGWNTLLWGWLGARLQEQSLSRARYLCLLPIVAFPWLSVDCQFLTWDIRIVDAWGMEQVFALFDVPVLRYETVVNTPYINFEVVEGCAGLGTLQSMLIAGSVLAYFQNRTARLFPTICKIVVLAFVANCARIICIGALGLLFGAEVAQGPMHDWTGWILVVLFFFAAFPPPPPTVSLRPYLAFTPSDLLKDRDPS